MSIEGMCLDSACEVTYDADGNIVRSGDEVWVEDTHGESKFFKRTVAKCFEHKVLYTETCPYGYIGAKCSLIHKQHP